MLQAEADFVSPKPAVIVGYPAKAIQSAILKRQSGVAGRRRYARFPAKEQRYQVYPPGVNTPGR